MALMLKKTTANETIKVVCRLDDAIPKDISDADFQLYQESLDESFLNLKAVPTRFVLRLNLPYAAQKTVTSEQIGVTADGKAEVRLGFMLEDVRCSLVDIENPPTVPEEDKLLYAKEGDGFASKELISRLHGAGIVTELFAARQAAVGRLSAPKK